MSYIKTKRVVNAANRKQWLDTLTTRDTKFQADRRSRQERFHEKLDEQELDVLHMVDGEGKWKMTEFPRFHTHTFDEFADKGEHVYDDLIALNFNLCKRIASVRHDLLISGSPSPNLSDVIKAKVLQWKDVLGSHSYDVFTDMRAHFSPPEHLDTLIDDDLPDSGGFEGVFKDHVRSDPPGADQALFDKVWSEYAWIKSIWSFACHDLKVLETIRGDEKSCTHFHLCLPGLLDGELKSQKQSAENEGRSSLGHFGRMVLILEEAPARRLPRAPSDVHQRTVNWPKPTTQVYICKVDIRIEVIQWAERVMLILPVEFQDLSQHPMDARFATQYDWELNLTSIDQ